MAASNRSRSWSGGSTAVAVDTTAMVSRTARTSSVKARATSSGASASWRSIVVVLGLRYRVQRVGRRKSHEIGVGRLGHETPRHLRSPRMASRIRDLIVARFADNRSDTCE